MNFETTVTQENCKLTIRNFAYFLDHFGEKKKIKCECHFQQLQYLIFTMHIRPAKSQRSYFSKFSKNSFCHDLAKVIGKFNYTFPNGIDLKL